MPADLASTIFLILLNAADTVERLWPYVVGGVGLAVLLPRIVRDWRQSVPPWLPRPLTALLAALIGVASPVPTMAMVPLALRLRTRGLSAGAVLAFVLASSLMNPQLFVLTLGALGTGFALAQLVSVIVLSVGLGLALGSGLRASGIKESFLGKGQESARSQLMGLVSHVGTYFLLGVIAGASLQVLLPRFGVLDWLGGRGLLATPALGWLGAPFYTCGGSAVPLASSLLQTGFSPGTLFAFLLVGPVLRGTTLATLSCMLSKRTRTVCLAMLAVAGGLLGYGFDLLMRML